MVRLSALLLLPLATALAAEPSLTGLWEGTVHANGADIPFRFEIGTAGPTHAEAAFFNGDERVRSTSGRFVEDSLTLEFALYAGKLKATLANGELTGTYQKGVIPAWGFRARRYQALVEEATAKLPNVSGVWDIQAKSAKGESAWRMMIRQSGREASGTVQRIDGDTGALTGGFRDGRLVLSHFSGARPSLFEIVPQADGTLEVTQNGKAKYVAVRSSEARAQGLPEPADPSRWTSLKNPVEPLHFAFPDLQGKVVNDSDPRFAGKVVLVSVTGSWCPNCHDEAPFLGELYRKYKAKGLEIVGLAFEEDDQLPNLPRLKAFLKMYGIEYTMLVAGDPDKAAQILPQVVNLNTFPATFFVGRDGLVRGSHAGYAGKATGEAHEHLKAEITATVERLLAENTVSASR